MVNKIRIPRDTAFIINKLEENGYEAYVVGGCVRDSLLGIEPHDWDICTSALPEQVIEVFNEYKVLLTGLQHGTVTIIIDTEPYEITTYRIDGEYEDNRHPTKVEFVSNLELDLMRRDFTINAMAYNDKNGLVDLFGGIEDIKNKVIRCVGNPDERFTEDALRMLRAIRFAVRFGCAIEKETMCSLLAHKSLLKNISVERISSELTKTLSYPNDIKSATLMATLIELLKTVVPDMYLVDSEDVCQRLIRSNPVFEIRLATLFDFKDIETVLKQLRFSNDIVSDVVSIKCYGHKVFDERLIWKDNKYKYYSRKLLHDLGYKNALRAVEYATLLTHEQDSNTMLLLKLLSHYISESNRDGSVYTLSGLDINGNDLLELGYKGKQIGNILNHLLDMVMRDMVLNTKEELIKCIHNIE